jgi:ferredoxin, 2Fe-2S
MVQQGDARVRVLPAAVELSVAPGETVFAAAHRAGYAWPTVCGGLGDCGTCLSQVAEGQEHCLEPGDLERETLARVLPGRPGAGARFRLACQLRVTGAVTLSKRGVRPVP